MKEKIETILSIGAGVVAFLIGYIIIKLIF